jgi:hypothetical protein
LPPLEQCSVVLVGCRRRTRLRSRHAAGHLCE